MGNYNNYSRSEEFQSAKVVELEFLRFMEENGKKCKKSILQEEYDDIDMWVYSNDRPIGVSIKNQQITLKTGNVGFEEYNNGNPSWWLSGKAEWYDIKWGDEHHIFLKEDLKERIDFLEKNGKVVRKGLTKKQNLTNISPQEVVMVLVRLEDIEDLIKMKWSINND